MYLLWLCNWLLSTLQCFEKWALVMQYRIYSKPTKLNAPLKVITAFLSPPSCLFSEAQHVSHFACPNYKCMLPSWNMTAAIRLQKLWHDCHNISVLWPRKKKTPHIYSLGGAVKAWVWQMKKGRASNRGKRSSEWDSVLLYWSSLVSGFLSERSLLPTWEIPPSPISRDDSPPLLRSRGRPLGAFR